MRYDYAINQIIRDSGALGSRQLRLAAQKSFRHRQLQAARANPKGWPWLARQQWVHNDGGYSTGNLGVTQDSRDVTLVGGTFPTTMDDWRIVIAESSGESYDVESRTAASAVKITRPYEGSTDDSVGYKAYDPYLQLPSDLWFWESLVLEADSKRLWETTRHSTAGRWPKQEEFSEGRLVNIARVSTRAGYSTGTVTLAKGSAAVTGSGTTFPEWIVGHHIRVTGDNRLYKISKWDSTTALTLTRKYGGPNVGAGKEFEIDPAGAMQVEVTYPRLGQYGLRVDYMALPEDHVNDADEIEGDEAYIAAIVDMATADLIRMHGVNHDMLTEGMVREVLGRAQALEQRGMSALSNMVGSNAPQPEEGASLLDVRYAAVDAAPWRWLRGR